jgi:flagellin
MTESQTVPLNSVNTNVGAMQALQSFAAINAEMSQVLTRISTGLRVSSPKDNPAVWAIAQNQRAQVSALNAVTGSLQRGQSIADLAIIAGESISDMIGQMKGLALAALDYPAGDPARTALNDQYLGLRKLIDTTANSASFGGVNLLSAGSAGNVRSLANADATQTIDVDHVDLTTGGATLSGLPADLIAVSTADLAAINTAEKAVNSAVSKLGTGSKALDIHLTFIGKLQDTIEASIGNLVDADLAKESARLAALKVRQQLALIAMRIANEAPSLLLQLFRFNR